MRSIANRVTDLERRSGGHDVPASLIVSFVRAGPDGPIYYDPSGYTTSLSDDRAPRWYRQPKETIAQLQDRVDRDTPCGPGCMAILYECHD